jgi:teichuronic acid biosynthesis glycosyltransferase TuaC
LAQNASRPTSVGSRKLDAVHVLTLTPFFPSSENPVYGTYISEPIEHFSECDLRSTVIAVSPLHHAHHSAVPGAHAAWLRYPMIPGNAGLTTAGWFLYRRLLRRVQQIHQRSAIHLIHAHAALPCGHAASLLEKCLRVPFVVTIHGLDVFNACFEPGSEAAKRRGKLSMDVYRRAASVIGISRTVQDILRQGMKETISSRVIYNGTNPELFSPSEKLAPNGPPNILMVGNLLRGKGQEIVFKAMAQVASQFPDLTCTLIGEGRDEQEFIDMVRKLGMAERVSFRGRRDRRAVAEAMRECTVFALPSRFEGLGCAYLEAMGCGKPVIACEGQGIGEIIRHRENGWLIPVDSVEEMTDALRQLLSPSDLRRKIGIAARQTILNGLTLTDQVRHLNDLYREVAQI